MYPPVLSKHDFVVRYELGEFGNHSPTWNNLEEMAEDYILETSPEGQLFHVRNRIASGETWYNIPVELLADVWYNAASRTGEENFYISAMAPTEKTLFQGEVVQGAHSLDLTYTTIAKPMRDALKEEAIRAEGIIASSLLKYYLCPKSLDWLNVLIERYPGHAIEFSTYSVEWGTLPGFNTVIWEVRKY